MSFSFLVNDFGIPGPSIHLNTNNFLLKRGSLVTDEELLYAEPQLRRFSLLRSTGILHPDPDGNVIVFVLVLPC